MTFSQLEDNVLIWSCDRGILAHSTPAAQLLKAVSEMGELADAEIKGGKDEKMDAVGDVMVCLMNYAEMNCFDLTSALESAWNEIKDRNGRMVPGGAFVKDEE